MSGISQYVDVIYLTKENASFYKTEGGFLGLTLGGEDKGRVGAFRMYPLTNPDLYISVRDNDLKELGVIRALDELPEQDKALVEDELKKRYFVPKILSVSSVKEEFNYTNWVTKTDAGDRNFMVFDMANSLVKLDDVRVMLIDVDGNRYEIPDYTKLPDKVLKFIDMWL